jgi:hypothetical protein
MKHIAILTCVWRRFDLNEMFYRYVHSLIKKCSDSVQISMVVVGSEGLLSRRLTEMYGFTYIEANNQPLSTKWQRGLDYLRDHQPDAVLILGSDDFISPGLIEYYNRLMHRQDVLAVGVLDAYFLDIASGRWIYWPGYGRSTADTQPQRLGEPIGAGRLLKVELLRKVNFEVWSQVEIDKGLDKECFLRLSKFVDTVKNSDLILEIGERPAQDKWVVIDASSIGEAILDVKTDVFVTDFKNYKSDFQGDMFEYKIYGVIKRLFSRQLCIDLLKLRLSTKSTKY